MNEEEKPENNISQDEANNEEKSSGVDTALDLVETIITYIKEQISKVTHDSFFGPLENFRNSLFVGIISAFLFGSAAIFLSISFILLLQRFVGGWLSYFIVAVALILAGLAMNRGKK